MENSRHIAFVKMQATGNDFILLDNRQGQLDESEISDLAPDICDRKFGVGSDGIIALEVGSDDNLVMRYKNPDGSDAGMCGNGARCFTLFAQSLGFGDSIRFRVHDKTYRAEITQGGGPGVVSLHFPLETVSERIKVDDKSLLQVYTNTEHVVCIVEPETLEKEDLLIAEGRLLRNHPEFAPKGTNANFISGVDSDELNLQTYERGVEDLTLACGTGAIASALAWHTIQAAGEGSFNYIVHTRGGDLTVRFAWSDYSQTYRDVTLEGPATAVFEGSYFTDSRQDV